jgi:hypothetical protein
MKFAASSERFASTLAPEQKSLLEETLDTDLAELEREIERERSAGDKAKDKTEKKTPKRTPLPPQLPRRDVPTSRPTPSAIPRVRAADAALGPGRGRAAGLPARRVHR